MTRNQLEKSVFAKIATLHPAVITSIFLVIILVFIQLVEKLNLGIAGIVQVYAVIGCFLYLLFLFWIFGIVKVVNSKAARRTTETFHLLGFVAFPIFFVMIGTMLPPETEETSWALKSFAGLVLASTSICYCGSMWVTASALVNPEKNSGFAYWLKSVIAFLLIYAFPIGVWFLHKRIKEVALSEEASFG